MTHESGCRQCGESDVTVGRVGVGGSGLSNEAHRRTPGQAGRVAGRQMTLSEAETQKNDNGCRDAPRVAPPTSPSFTTHSPHRAESLTPLSSYHVLLALKTAPKPSSPAPHPPSHNVQHNHQRFLENSPPGGEGTPRRMGGAQVWWYKCRQVCRQYSGDCEVSARIHPRASSVPAHQSSGRVSARTASQSSALPAATIPSLRAPPTGTPLSSPSG